MSEELSRVKSRAKAKSANKPAAAAKTASRRASGRIPDTKGAAAALSRSKRSAPREAGSAAESKPAVRKPKEPAVGSRVSKHSAAAAGSRRSAAGRSGRAAKTEGSTPSRASKHSSERVRLSKIFVNSLQALFLALLAMLLLWGVKGAPPLNELW
ncbi:hypothetical protein F4V43_01525 [Paenibacillus spiritus]|uniref:Uncharacterized protein n=1 Tax=Paenibacillus spiritus TaxID=2496557 RepID=A0A5J5GHH9_9BACL|nr:hypothetical protein [Paenibacillus spiritus]KAA9007193.1 hypothetical protein F4V43_01525 [Paenibacillus spiritus]